jgi:hypothetical protein
VALIAHRPRRHRRGPAPATGPGSEWRRSCAGRHRHYEFTANYDGKDNPLVGNSANGDMIAFMRINATTTHAVTKHGGQVAVTMTLVVSSDARTLTITSTGTNVFRLILESLGAFP